MGVGEPGPIDRREFLKRSALAGVGIGLAPLAGGAEKRPPGVRRHALLGRTGLRVSDIGFGGSRLAYQGTAIESAAEDVYAVCQRGKPVRIVETSKNPASGPGNSGPMNRATTSPGQ